MKISKDLKIVILGAGLAGLGAGMHYKKNGFSPIILEKENKVGGLFSNSSIESCDFDYGPKILLLDDSNDRDEILSFLGDNYERYPVAESVYIRDYGFVSFPLQRHLIELPVRLRKKIISDLKKSQISNTEIYSFKDWLVSNYGKSLAELILIPYEEKKWQIDLDEMDYRWALSRPVKVDMDEVIKGSKVNLPANKSYYYPKTGNISQLTQEMAKKAGKVLLNHNVTHIDLKKKVISVGNKEFSYDVLISTLPLDFVVTMTNPISRELVGKTSKKLKRLSIKVFNLVFDKNHDLTGTAIYFPEKDFIFRRVSVLQNLCPALARKGKTPISVEVSVNPHNDMSDNEIYEKIMEGFSNIKQFKKLGKPITYEVKEVDFAYPLQTRGHSYHVADLHRYYDDFDVYHCGRGGTFDYCNGDEAYTQGKELANKLIKNMSLSPKYELSLTVGIPSYNSGFSIVETVTSLRNSNNIDNFNIMVSVDGPTLDKKIEKELKKLDVAIIHNKEREGQTARNKQIADMTQTDLLVMTQDDVLFEPDTLANIVDEFKKSPEITMIAPKVKPLSPENIFENSLHRGVNITQNISKKWRNGDNYLSSVGRCLAYRSSMIKDFEISPEIINCDAYYYFENKRLGGYFKFLENAVVKFRSPQNMDEHLKQVRKFVVSQQEMNNYLKMDLNTEYNIPKKDFFIALLSEFMKHPVLTSYYLIISIYSRTRPKKFYEDVTRFWNIDKSTKQVNH